MSKLKKLLKKKKGYVSIETIICAGLIIGLGVFTISAFQSKGNTITKKAMTNIETAMGSYDVVDPGTE